MEKKIAMIIDGQSVTTEPGQTVLQAARQAGIKIPTLCYDPQLKPSGACRMCLVQVQKGSRKRLVASCCYPAEEGLVVTTDNEQIRKLRKLIIELLWPAWTQLGKEYGLTGSRFEHDQTDCSQCGLCVRYCAEVAKKNAVFFKGRGIDRRPAFTPGLEDECDSCRQCFGRCTGGWLITEHGRGRESNAEQGL